MRVAGYILTGLRRCRSQAHPPMILAHGLATDFFGIEELSDPYPDFESFDTWPATARVLWALRGLDQLAGQSSVADFGHWYDPQRRRIILCSRKEMARARYECRLVTNYQSNKTAS